MCASAKCRVSKVKVRRRMGQQLLVQAEEESTARVVPLGSGSSTGNALQCCSKAHRSLPVRPPQTV